MSNVTGFVLVARANLVAWDTLTLTVYAISNLIHVQFFYEKKLVMRMRIWGYLLLVAGIVLVACSSGSNLTPLTRTLPSEFCSDKPLHAVRLTCTATHKANASIISFSSNSYSFRKLLWDEVNPQFTIKQADLPNTLDDPNSTTLNYYSIVNNSQINATAIWKNQWSPKIFHGNNENVFYTYYFADENASGPQGDRDIVVMEFNGGATNIQPLTPLSEVKNQTRVTRDPILENPNNCLSFEPSQQGCYPLLSQLGSNNPLADKINCFDNLSFDSTTKQFKQQACINHSNSTVIPIENGFVSLYSAGILHSSINSGITYGKDGYFDKSVVLKTFEFDTNLPTGQKYKEKNAVDLSLVVNDLLISGIDSMPTINCNNSSINSNLKTPIRHQVNPSGVYLNGILYIAYVTQIFTPDTNGCYNKMAGVQRFDLVSLQRDPSNGQWVKKQRYTSPLDSDGFIDSNLIVFKNKIFLMVRAANEQLKIFRLTPGLNGAVTDDRQEEAIFDKPWDLSTNMEVECRSDGNGCYHPKAPFPYINKDNGSPDEKLKILYLFTEGTTSLGPDFPLNNIFSVTLPNSIICGDGITSPVTCN